MDRALTGLAKAACATVGLASCGPSVVELDTGPLAVSQDFRGLTGADRQADEWAALSLTLQPDVAAKLNRGAFTSATLFLFPCGQQGPDTYPAPAYLDGRSLTAEGLERHAGAVTLVFHLPRNRRALPVQTRNAGSYDCAELMAGGTWPSVYVSKTLRLPANLTFRRLPPSDPSLPAGAP